MGIPTVADRIAQMVVKRYLGPLVEPVFHKDPYGYRPGKSALDAVGVARQRCWRQGWVLDPDIKAFFDSIDWSLLMRAVRKHTRCPWVLTYIERWLKAPAQMADGSLIVRERGIPQGGVISPMLANLFLHYAFDTWMTRDHPGIRFERYADDAICHCTSEAEASALRRSLEGRFADCGLTLHPEKTKIVYCKDDDRRGTYPDQKFDFLGYTFRPRLSRRRRNTFGVSLSPAASDKALKAIRQTVRSWTLHERSDKTLDDLARMFNASIRGWITTTGATTSRRFTRPYGTSIAYWHDGRIGSSSPSDVTGGERSSGWLASRDANRCCLLTGGCCRGMAERWEPDEARIHVRFCERLAVLPPATLLVILSRGHADEALAWTRRVMTRLGLTITRRRPPCAMRGRSDSIFWAIASDRTTTGRMVTGIWGRARRGRACNASRGVWGRFWSPPGSRPGERCATD